MDLRSTIHETENVFAAQELFHRSRLDGRVSRRAADRSRGAGVSPTVQLWRPITSSAWSRYASRAITAEKVAVNAVMAGCLPEHFPVVVTALAAMLREEFTLHGATASTGGCAVFIVDQRRSAPRPRDGRHVQRARQQ